MATTTSLPAPEAPKSINHFSDFWRSLQPQEDVRADRRTPKLGGACSAHGNSRNGCRRHAQHEDELERLHPAQSGREPAIRAALRRSKRSGGHISGQVLVQFLILHWGCRRAHLGTVFRLDLLGSLQSLFRSGIALRDGLWDHLACPVAWRHPEHPGYDHPSAKELRRRRSREYCGSKCQSFLERRCAKVAGGAGEFPGSVLDLVHGVGRDWIHRREPEEDQAGNGLWRGVWTVGRVGAGEGRVGGALNLHPAKLAV